MENADAPVTPAAFIEVEVVYGKTGAARVIKQQVANNATLREAIEQSGILEMFPEIDLDRTKVGIFSKKRDLRHVLQAGDRVEIYQPLRVDPKEARRRRAKKEPVK